MEASALEILDVGNRVPMKMMHVFDDVTAVLFQTCFSGLFGTNEDHDDETEVVSRIRDILKCSYLKGVPLVLILTRPADLSKRRLSDFSPEFTGDDGSAVEVGTFLGKQIETDSGGR
eukprot:898007_1